MNVPLCVDLDGTLIKGDISVEALLLAFKHNPLKTISALASGGGSLARTKVHLAKIANPDPSTSIPNKDFLSYLQDQKSAGRKIILISASTDSQVKQYGEYYGLFDESVGSTETRNFKGSKKAEYLVERFGEKQFDYAGNGSVDLPVWRKSRKSIVVNANSAVISKARKIGNVEAVFGELNESASVWIKTARVYQWVKNLLVFLPLFLSHSISAPSFVQALVGFFAFSFVASSIYIVNDLFDLESDRTHPTKKNRPIPAGRVTLQNAIQVSFLLGLAGISLGVMLGLNFLCWLLLYAALSKAYSFWLKRQMLIDIFILAALYVIRIMAGGAAAAVFVSPWMMAFSLFLFLSLAAAKRFIELSNVEARGESRAHGRGYGTVDRIPIGTLGACAGYISVVIFTLYISSSEVKTLYSRPEALWLITPLLLYWMSRLWLLAHRNEVHEDPVLFALRDFVSYSVLVLCSIVVLLAI